MSYSTNEAAINRNAALSRAASFAADQQEIAVPAMPTAW